MFIFELVMSIFAKPKVKYNSRLKVRLSCEGVKPKFKFKSMSVKVRMPCKDVKPRVKFKAVSVRKSEHVEPKVKFKGMSVKTNVRMKCERVKPKVKINCIKLVLSASLA